MATKTSSKRLYAPDTPQLREALAAAPEADIVAERSSNPARLEAWALFGFQKWREEHEEALRLAAYEQVARDTERTEYIGALNERAMQAGIL